MSESKSMYETVPAMQGIHRVEGFHPQKYLRQTISRITGQMVWKLDLRYMRAWFRIACPNGRMRFKPLKITEQMAVFEAAVYLDRSDNEPFSNFTAQCTQEEAEDGNFIKAAQDAALETALCNAGFGIQFVDVSYDGAGESYGHEVPVNEKEAKKPIVEAVGNSLDLASGNVPGKISRIHMEPESRPESIAEPDSLPVPPSKIQEEMELPVQAAEASYTSDMPVEEILKVMTFEEAQNVVVDVGTCNGWTMQEVAEKRAPNLKFYYYGGYKGDNNAIRAAAKIMLDSLEEKMAG